MNKFLQLLTIGAVLTLSSITVNARNVGIGTAPPGQKLEIAGNTNTIRIHGLMSGSTFNSGVTALTSNILYVNNTTGSLVLL